MRNVLQAKTLGLIVGQRADLSPLKINTMLPSGSCHQLHSPKPRPGPGCEPVSPPWVPYGHSVSCRHAWCHRHFALILTADYRHLSTGTAVFPTQMPLSCIQGSMGIIIIKPKKERSLQLIFAEYQFPYARSETDWYIQYLWKSLFDRRFDELHRLACVYHPSHFYSHEGTVFSLLWFV